MPLAGEKNLNNLLSILRGTYKSIDIRAVLAKNMSLKNDKTWYCIFLKIRPTNQEIKDVQLEQKKRFLPYKHKSYFRVVFDCKPIDQIENILKEIQEGRVNVGGILSKPVGFDYDSILNKDTTNDSGFSTNEESNGFSSKIVCTPMYYFPINTIERWGIKKDDIDITANDLEYCLSIASIANSNNIVVMLPIYCKRLSVSPRDRGKYLAIFQIHRVLVGNLKARIRISPDGRTADTKSVSFSNFKTITKEEQTGEMITAALPLSSNMKKAAQPEDYIEIQISHKKLPSIRLTEQLWAREILPKKGSHDAPKKIIERIDPDLRILELWLEGKGKRKDDRPIEFERAVTILLSLCGFCAMHVGDNYETLPTQARHESHRKSSTGTDVIAFTPPEVDMIFLCQCTTNWDKRKLNDILDFSNEIEGILDTNQVRIYPIIFTQLQANQISASISDAEKQGVRVVTIDELRNLLTNIRSGYKSHELAVSIMSYSILSRYSDG